MVKRAYISKTEHKVPGIERKNKKSSINHLKTEHKIEKFEHKLLERRAYTRAKWSYITPIYKRILAQPPTHN